MFAFDEIMRADDPMVCKKLGRKVSGFVETTWMEALLGVAETVLMAKFYYSPALSEVLAHTGSALLVEAARRDQLWGVGLEIGDRAASSFFRAQIRPRAITTAISNGNGGNRLRRSSARRRQCVVHSQPQCYINQLHLPRQRPAAGFSRDA